MPPERNADADADGDAEVMRIVTGTALIDVPTAAIENRAFRRVLHTDRRVGMQVVAMRITYEDHDIGEEVHATVQQSFLCVNGVGAVLTRMPDGELHSAPLRAGTLFVVPPDVRHNVVNTDEAAQSDLLFVTFYYGQPVLHDDDEVELAKP
jgi:mannose-6-phosphate isomerase-like protein (cupin superfamily)